MVKILSLILLLVIYEPVKASQPSEEQLVAKFEHVIAPPKNINDVIRLLDSSKPDLEKVRKYQELAKSSPGSNFTKLQIYEYSKEKFTAVESLGLIKELDPVCKLNLESADSQNKEQYLDAQMICINADFLQGNYSKMQARVKEALDHPYFVENDFGGWKLAILSLQINAFCIMGDTESAEKILPQLENTLAKLRYSKSWSRMRNHWIYQAEKARGSYFLTVGKFDLAESSFKKAYLSTERILNDSDYGNVDTTRRAFSKETVLTNKADSLHLLARTLRNQGKLIEAEHRDREALRTILTISGRNNFRVVTILNSISLDLSEQGRGHESNVLAEYALKVVQESGLSRTSPKYLDIVNAYAASLVNVEKYNEALVQFEVIRSAINSDELLKKIYKKYDLDEVVASVFANNYSKAETISKALLSYEKTKVGDKHARTAFAQAFYAIALDGQNRKKEARENFASSIPILIDYVRNNSESQTLSLKNQKRFKIITETYISLLFDEAKSEQKSDLSSINQAFLLADIARGSSVQKAVAQSTARSTVKDSRLSDLSRKEQDLQRRISSLNELLLVMSQSTSDRSSDFQSRINNEISDLKSERETVKNSIKSSYPEYFDLIEPKPITIERAAKLLKPSEVLVAWYIGDRKSFVWAINHNGLSGSSTLNVTNRDILRDVRNLRKSLDPGVASVDEIPAFDVALSFKLYTLLIKPIESSLNGKELLISVPHESLGQLPISVLLTQAIKQPAIGSNSFLGYQNAPWLIRKIAISQLPSVNALAALRVGQTERSNKQNFIAFADPYFSKNQATAATRQQTAQLSTRGLPLNLRSVPKTSKVSSAELALLPRLPDTSIEVTEIGKILESKPEDIFLHENASVKKVLGTDFSKKNIIMFATHGLVPGELNGLTQPALALSSPDVTGESEGDGLLTMDKILELKLNADWVVLSACNTASSGNSLEAVSGLGRAFFYAGARALLVSNWPVETVSSRELMVDLFKRQMNQTKITKPEALRQAMLNIADKGGSRDSKTNAVSYSYAHPLFWAPFVMVGD